MRSMRTTTPSRAPCAPSDAHPTDHREGMGIQSQAIQSLAIVLRWAPRIGEDASGWSHDVALWQELSRLATRRSWTRTTLDSNLALDVPESLGVYLICAHPPYPTKARSGNMYSAVRRQSRPIPYEPYAPVFSNTANTRHPPFALFFSVSTLMSTSGRARSPIQ